MTDFRNQYNTELPQESVEPFFLWAMEESKQKGRNIFNDMQDYDLQGYFLSGMWKGGSGGHGPDTFKKPNHPTFSNESMYHGVDEYKGGKWGENSFTPSETNLEFFNKGQYSDYFMRFEPGITLDFQK